MPEDTADDLEGCSALQEMNRQRVAQTMCALEGNPEAAVPNRA